MMSACSANESFAPVLIILTLPAANAGSKEDRAALDARPARKLDRAIALDDKGFVIIGTNLGTRGNCFLEDRSR